MQTMRVLRVCRAAPLVVMNLSRLIVVECFLESGNRCLDSLSSMATFSLETHSSHFVHFVGASESHNKDIDFRSTP